MRKLTVLSICIVLVCGLSFTASAIAASDEEAVLQIAANFAKATTNNDYELMSSLWWNSPKTSTYGPPKGLAFLTEGYDAIMDWMKTMADVPAGTYVRTIQNPQVMMLGKDVAVLTTYSIFTQNPPAVEVTANFQERMTFVVQKIGGKWLIVHGHGSAFPTE